jgi:hypothetical protein
MQYPQKYTGTVCINATRQLAGQHFLKPLHKVFLNFCWPNAAFFSAFG